MGRFLIPVCPLRNLLYLYILDLICGLRKLFIMKLECMNNFIFENMCRIDTSWL